MYAFNWVRIAAVAALAMAPVGAADVAPAHTDIAAQPAAIPPGDAPATAAVDKEAKKAFMDQAKDLLDKSKADAPADGKADPKPGDKPADKPADKPEKKPLDKNALKLVETYNQLQKDLYTFHNRNHINDYFKTNYALIELLPEFVYLGQETRDRLAEENKDMAAYFKTNAKTIAALEDLIGTFQQRLGLEGVKIDVPRKMYQAAPPPTKVTGDIDLSGAPGADQAPKDVSREMTQTERYQVSICEDHLKRLAMYQARQSYVECERDWQGLLDNLPGLYFSQLMIQNDPRFGLTYAESLKFLRTLHAGKVIIPGTAGPTAAADDKHAKKGH